MSADREAPYAELGALLSELRQKAGIAQQSQLAELIKTSQQTISRWEAGSSRPRARQVPLLARVLRTKAEELLIAAGYAPKTTVASFDKPFPVDGLSPESKRSWSIFIPMRPCMPLAPRAIPKRARISMSRFEMGVATPSNASEWFNLVRAMSIRL